MAAEALVCHRHGDGGDHDEAFRCEACERPVCGYCAEPVGNEWLCASCEADPANPAGPRRRIPPPRAVGFAPGVGLLGFYVREVERL